MSRLARGATGKEAVMTREANENQQLIKLRDKYQEKADKYWEDYQIDGQASQLRAYERNERLADALTDAITGKSTKNKLFDLKCSVMELDTGADIQTLLKRLKYLQKQIEDGRF